MQGLSGGLLAIVGGAFTLAIVAVLVAQRAQTPTVIGSAGTALANVIAAAVAPVTSSNNTFGSTGSVGAGGFHFTYP